MAKISVYVCDKCGARSESAKDWKVISVLITERKVVLGARTPSNKIEAIQQHYCSSCFELRDPIWCVEVEDVN